jgi:hypothetical protein
MRLFPPLFPFKPILPPEGDIEVYQGRAATQQLAQFRVLQPGHDQVMDKASFRLVGNEDVVESVTSLDAAFMRGVEAVATVLRWLSAVDAYGAV